MGFLVIFIQKAIGQGIGILYGALGEIMTEQPEPGYSRDDVHGRDCRTDWRIFI